MKLTSYVREDVVRKKPKLKRTDDSDVTGTFGTGRGAVVFNNTVVMSGCLYYITCFALDSHLLEISYGRVLGAR
jgi:hypothetical protein